MPVIYLPKKFIENCQKYIEKHPRAGDDPADFIARCGRLGLWYLDKMLTEEEKRDCPCPDDEGDKAEPFQDGDEEGDKKIPVYIPDKDFEAVRRLVVRKLGITTTVTAWYLICVFMVMYGYWELPPKV